MKKYYLSALILFLVLSACNSTSDKAIDYNDKIIAEQVLVVQSINKLDREFVKLNAEKIEIAINESKIQIDKSIKVLENLGGFEGDMSFVDSGIDFFKTIKKLLNNEFAKQLEIYKYPTGKFSEENIEKYNNLSKQIEEKYNIANDNFVKSQTIFTSKWNFEIVNY